MIFKNILNGLLGSEKGVLGIIAEKSGKISFRRSAAIVVLTAIVAPDVAANGLTWINAVIIIVCVVSPSIPKVIGKSSEKE